MDNNVPAIIIGFITRTMQSEATSENICLVDMK